MSSPYTEWLGQTVVLQVSLGDLKVPLRGQMLSETQDGVRVRIGGCWDVEVFKTMIMAVEQAVVAVQV